MRAFVALKSWKALITQGENNMDPDDYDTLLWAAKPALEDMASSGVSLPPKVDGGNMKKMWVCFDDYFLQCLSSMFLNVVKQLLVPGWLRCGRCMLPCLTIKGAKWQNGQKSRSLRITSTAQWCHHLTQDQVRNELNASSQHFLQ